MRKFILITLLLLSVNVQAKDYGIAHTIPVLVAAHVLPEINGALFKEYPVVAKALTKLQLSVMVGTICQREAEARGTWRIQGWHRQTGSYDSTMDCLLPAAVGGLEMYKGGFVINIIDINW